MERARLLLLLLFVFVVDNRNLFDLTNFLTRLASNRTQSLCLYTIK